MTAITLPILAHSGRFALAKSVVVLCWSYAAAATLWLLLHESEPESVWWLANWCAVPLQIIAMAAIGLLLSGGRLQQQSRALWWLVLSFTALSLLACFVWNFSYSDPHGLGFSFGDALYLFDYLLLTAALMSRYRAAGGQVLRLRFWLDALTVMVALLVVYSQFMSSEGIGVRFGLATTVGYMATLSIMMVMCATLLTQQAGRRGQLTVLLLVAAALAEAAGEFAWVAGQLNGRSYVDLYYDYGDVVCFLLITTAVYFERYAVPARVSEPSVQESANGFLPALLVLLAVAVLAGASSSAQGSANWTRVVLVLIGAGLLALRQRAMQREISRLSHELTIRQSNERAMELVRSSTDVIAVCNEYEQLVFVSPAAQAMLRRSPAELLNTPADLLLGAAQQSELSAFLERLRTGAEREAEYESAYNTPSGEQRILRVMGTNRAGNPLINGIVLALSDVTASRGLEREIINIATRERLRLCSDIHEGLGQELSGIALLLHSAAAHPNADPAAQRRSLESIVGHVNHSIETTRNLAEELSPIQIARGSLVAALERLVQDLGTRLQLPVRLDAPPEEPFIDAAVADHLYRIAQEATSNAVRHSGCTQLEIELRSSAQALDLSISDNGRGMDPLRPRSRGLGHRMMNYRARLIGGNLKIDSPPGGGTRVGIHLALPGTL
jgi:PAS domain S-box-containing protein